MMVKSGDDLRMEQFAMQLVEAIDQIFKSGKLNMKMRPYEILATSSDGGLIEFCQDSLPVSHIRRIMTQRFGPRCDLYDYYRVNYGSVTSKEFKQA